MDYRIILLAGALVCAACIERQDPLADTVDNEVRFYASTANMSTKGGIETDVQLQAAGVTVWGECYPDGTYAPTGDMAFDGVALTYNPDTGIWEYGDEKRWWNKEKNYDFTAWAPSDSRASYTEGLASVSGVDRMARIEDATDWLLSDTYTSVATTEKRPAVSLLLRHLLSRVTVGVRTSMDESYTVTLNRLSLNVPKGTGKAAFRQSSHGSGVAGDWTDEGEATDASVEMVSEENPLELSSMEEVLDETGDFLIVPDLQSGMTIDLTYTLTNSIGSKTIEKQGVEVSSIAGLEPGIRYWLTLTIQADAVSFDVDEVSGWAFESGEEEDIDVTLQEGLVFKAEATGFHIEGVLGLSGSPDGLEVQLGDDESLAPVLSWTDGCWYEDEACTIESASPAGDDVLRYTRFRIDYDASHLTSGAVYRLAFRRGSLVKEAQVRMPMFAEMSLTVSTDKEEDDFTLPLAAGAVSEPLAFVWGDGTEAVDDITAVTEENRRHVYTEAGEHHIRILSLQTDSRQPQITEWNFGKYPTQTADLPSVKNDNENGEKLLSMDSPLLRSSNAASLRTAFYGAKNLTYVHPDLFKAYGDVTDMIGVFCYCESLTSLPAGLLDHVPAVTTLAFAFAYCSALTSLPEGFFDQNVNLSNMYYTFAECSALETIPAGLLARNSQLYYLRQLFYNCTMLKLNADIFLDGEHTRENRFLDITQTQTLNLERIFSNVGTARTSDFGTIPDLWNYTYGEKGYGWRYYNTMYNVPVSTPMPGWTNKNEIPEFWYDSSLPGDDGKWVLIP